MGAEEASQLLAERAAERVERQDYKKEWWMGGRSRGYDTDGSYERWENGVTVGAGGRWGRVLRLDEYIFSVHHRRLITHPLHFVFKAPHNVTECHKHIIYSTRRVNIRLVWKRGKIQSLVRGPGNRFSSQNARVGVTLSVEQILYRDWSHFALLICDAGRRKSYMTPNRRPPVCCCFHPPAEDAVCFLKTIDKRPYLKRSSFTLKILNCVNYDYLLLFYSFFLLYFHQKYIY